MYMCWVYWSNGLLRACLPNPRAGGADDLHEPFTLNRGSPTARPPAARAGPEQAGGRVHRGRPPARHPGHRVQRLSAGLYCFHSTG